jgi:hypothetical protein
MAIPEAQLKTWSGQDARFNRSVSYCRGVHWRFPFYFDFCMIDLVHHLSFVE